MRVQRLRARRDAVGTGYRVDHGGKGSNQPCCRARRESQFRRQIGKDAFGEMALGLYRDEEIDAPMSQETDQHPTGVGLLSSRLSTVTIASRLIREQMSC